MFVSCMRCTQQNYETSTQCAYCGAPIASQVRAHVGREMKMKTTGYALKQAIKQQELRKDTAERMFDGSLRAYPDEKKESPQKIADQYITAERAIAKLQVAQARYNLAVGVEVLGEKMTLAEAIKRVGGEARIEKKWRTAAGPKTDRYGYRDDERDPSKVVKQDQVTPQEAVVLAMTSAKRAGALRAAIATGNATSIEIEDLNPALFE